MTAWLADRLDEVLASAPTVDGPPMSALALREWRNRAAPLIGYLVRDGRVDEADLVRHGMRAATLALAMHRATATVRRPTPPPPA